MSQNLNSILALVKAICEDYEKNHPEFKRIPKKKPFTDKEWQEVEKMQREADEQEPRDFNGGDGDND